MRRVDEPKSNGVTLLRKMWKVATLTYGILRKWCGQMPSTLLNHLFLCSPNLITIGQNVMPQTQIKTRYQTVHSISLFLFNPANLFSQEGPKAPPLSPCSQEGPEAPQLPP